MTWTIEYAQSVAQDVRKFDKQTQKRIRAFLETRVASLEHPRQIGKPLKGSKFENLWRYRVGDYRILCEIQDERIVVLVLEIGHRKDVYR